jgi:hypothetical protein
MRRRSSTLELSLLPSNFIVIDFYGLLFTVHHLDIAHDELNSLVFSDTGHVDDEVVVAGVVA